MKQTQKTRVIGKLLKDGFVTRNECLRGLNGGEPITRLGALIEELEQSGWTFEARYGKKKEGKERDYGYIVKTCPLKKHVYTVNGQTITNYTK